MDPALWFGDGDSQDWIKVEGDLVSTLAGLCQAMNPGSLTQKTRGLLARWLSFRQRNSPGGSCAPQSGIPDQPRQKMWSIP
jgi:hypothetical protein